VNIVPRWGRIRSMKNKIKIAGLVAVVVIGMLVYKSKFDKKQK